MAAFWALKRCIGGTMAYFHTPILRRGHPQVSPPHILRSALTATWAFALVRSAVCFPPAMAVLAAVLAAAFMAAPAAALSVMSENETLCGEQGRWFAAAVGGTVLLVMLVALTVHGCCPGCVRSCGCAHQGVQWAWTQVLWILFVVLVIAATLLAGVCRDVGSLPVIIGAIVGGVALLSLPFGCFRAGTRKPFGLPIPFDHGLR